MRKLASIQKIKKLEPIEGKDRIVLATILGWNVIVGKDEFKEGDLCCYFEIDSILPDIPQFEMVKKRSNKMRIRTLKFGNTISQGLALPLDAVRDIAHDLKSPLPYMFKEGDDVTELLKVKKYEDPEEVEDTHNSKRFTLMRYEWFRKLVGASKPKSSFPVDACSITDEIRCQAIPDEIEKYRDEHIIFNVTEKFDGQSATYVLDEVPCFFGLSKRFRFRVASRTRSLPVEDNSSYWQMARQYKIEQAMIKIFKQLKQTQPDLVSIVLQGEICGPKIQANRLRLFGNNLYLFNMILNYKSGERIKKSPINDKMLVEQGFQFVTELPSIMLPDTMDELVWQATGTYSWNNSIMREGLVFRNYEKGISFKVINPEYLLKHNC